MEIREIEKEVVIDNLPLTFDPNKKVFLTSLLLIDKRKIPQPLPHIYTNEVLKAQLTELLKSRGIEVGDSNFHVLKPFEPEKITLTNGAIYDVLPCWPQDTSSNMALIFKKGTVITHVYVGICSELHTILLNKTVLSWLRRDSYAKLYLPLKTCSCVECELEKAIIGIKRRIAMTKKKKVVLIQVPTFGFEYYIAKIASVFPGRVFLHGTVKQAFMKMPNAKIGLLTDDLDLAKIVIAGRDSNHELTTNLEQNNGIIIDKSPMGWSPLPPLRELDVLKDVFRPKQPYDMKYDYYAKPFIRRSLVFSDHCCLQYYHAFAQAVVDSLMKRVNYQKPSESPNQQENSTAVQAAISPGLQSSQNPTIPEEKCASFCLDPSGDKENNADNCQK